MELVYLWVEEYKNIHNQGFNFSPRFHCNYDPDTNELSIDENDDYIENFFGDNINVTAIVGKNGSGKSSVLEILFDGLYDTSFDTCPRKISNFIICYSIGGRILKMSSMAVNSADTKMQYMDVELTSEFNRLVLTKIFYNITLYSKYNNLSQVNRLEAEELSFSSVDNQRFYYLKYYDYKSIDQINLIYTIILYKNIKKKIKNIFYPNKVILRFYLHELVKQIQKKGYKEKVVSEIMSFSTAEDFLRNIIKLFIKVEKYASFMFRLDEDKLNGLLNDFFKKTNLCIRDFEYKKLQYILEIPNKSPDIIIRGGEKLPDLILEISFDESYPFNQLKRFFEYFFSLSCGCVDMNIQGLLDEQVVLYQSLSSGEKELVNIISRIKSISEKDKNMKIIVMDEPFHSFHPDWQKKVVNILIEIFKDLGVSIHFVFTTHSPFLLSDIPKQNIIFLDTDEEGKCKVVDGLKEKKQTFGANIHTLLSDSFFMEDGLMGEFAKGKINEIIDFHKVVEKEKYTKCLKKIYEKRKTKFWQTQSIIGEEYLKQIIKNHLVEIEKILLGKDEAKQQEIERTETYLKSLKNE